MASNKCNVCDDTGCCSTCEGRGTMPAPFGNSRLPCGTCFGSGECFACNEQCDTESDYQQSAASRQ